MTTPDQTPAEESTTPGSSTNASETTPLAEAASDLDSSPGETFANFLAAALNKGA